MLDTGGKRWLTAVFLKTVGATLEPISTYDQCLECYGLAEVSEAAGFLQDDQSSFVCRDYSGSFVGSNSFCCTFTDKAACELTSGYLCQTGRSAAETSASSETNILQRRLSCPKPATSNCGDIQQISITGDGFAGLELPITITDGSDEVCSYRVENEQSIGLTLKSEPEGSLQIFTADDLQQVSSIEDLTTASFYLVVTQSTNLKLLKAEEADTETAADDKDETTADGLPPS